MFQDCLEACSRVLTALEGAGGEPLQATVLQLRARAGAARGDAAAAAADAAAAAALAPHSTAAVLQHAEARLPASLSLERFLHQ